MPLTISFAQFVFKQFQCSFGLIMFCQSLLGLVDVHR